MNRRILKWDIQMAGYPQDKYDDQGIVEFNHFYQHFLDFPWIEQLNKINRLKEGSAPTLSVKDQQSEKDLWISIVGESNDYDYLIGYVYPTKRKRFFGLGKEVEIRWLEMYLTKEKEIIKDCFENYFKGEFEKLEEKLASLEEFDQLPARS